MTSRDGSRAKSLLAAQRNCTIKGHDDGDGATATPPTTAMTRWLFSHQALHPPPASSIPIWLGPRDMQVGQQGRQGSRGQRPSKQRVDSGGNDRGSPDRLEGQLRHYWRAVARWRFCEAAFRR
uniref:Uncharacterized protein n=1 Tax=Oryza punctata TaxID=4537 RepID=A0A0E0LCU1_ORYPU